MEGQTLGQIADLLTGGCIDIDSPITDTTNNFVFFPDQHPQLRQHFKPEELALRASHPRLGQRFHKKGSYWWVVIVLALFLLALTLLVFRGNSPAA